MTTRYDEADAATRPDGGPARDRPRALQRRPAQGLARPAGRPGRAGMAVHESQSLLVEMQVCRSRAVPRAIWRRCWPRRFGGDGAAFAADNLYRARDPRRARPHPGRCRRGHLSAARHPALPPREGAARGRPARSPTCPAPGTRACASCSASCRPTTAWAACRTSTGRPAPSAISPATRWARMMAAQLFEALRAAEPELRGAIARGRFPAAARAGCAPTSTSRARCSTPGAARPARPAARSSRSRSSTTSSALSRLSRA